MKLFVAGLLVALLLCSPNAAACVCAPGERPFLYAAATSRFVVLASVVCHRRRWPWGKYRYMDLKIEAVLRGPADLKSLVVTGDNGYECRHYVTKFPVGTRWVFAVSQYGSATDLAVSRCSESALYYDGAAVTGVIGTEAAVINTSTHSLSPETIPIEELGQRLQAVPAH